MKKIFESKISDVVFYESFAGTTKDGLPLVQVILVNNDGHIATVNFTSLEETIDVNIKFDDDENIILINEIMFELITVQEMYLSNNFKTLNIAN